MVKQSSHIFVSVNAFRRHINVVADNLTHRTKKNITMLLIKGLVGHTETY